MDKKMDKTVDMHKRNFKANVLKLMVEIADEFRAGAHSVEKEEASDYFLETYELSFARALSSSDKNSAEEPRESKKMSAKGGSSHGC